MTDFTLGLRAAPTGIDDPSIDGLLVLHADVGRLVALLLELGEGVSCHALATSVADPTAAGHVLVFARSRPFDSVGHPPGCLALCRVGGTLFLPRGAELWPPVVQDELAQLVAGQVALLLPAGRYFTFEPSAAIELVDLIELPAPRVVDWGRARPGTKIAPRLVSVTAPPYVRDSELFGGADVDIGALPVSKLPKSVDPSGTRQSKLADALRSCVTWFAAKLAGRRTQDHPTALGAGHLVARLRQWANTRALQDFTAQREREIERLLKLMVQDPAEGLRYALPLIGHGGRGVATPSARLGARNVEFDAHGLQRSAPVDDWSLGANLRQALLRRYHEHARLELELGRHRRAAYVYAHLIGDFLAAAQALDQGRHYREAAALWRDTLNLPARAAQALRDGGFDEEALEIYLSIRLWKHAAELLEVLGRTSEAHELWRAYATEREESGDHLEAAEVLERRVDAPEDAFAVLGRKLEAAPLLLAERLRWLALLARLERTDVAREWLVRESSQRLGATALREFAKILRALAEGAQGGEHESFAADRLRLIVGRALAERRPQDVYLLDLLAEPRPDDPLFNRDRRRFGVDFARRARSKPATCGVVLQRTFSIGPLDPARTSFEVVDALIFVVRPHGATDRARVECLSVDTGQCLAAMELAGLPPLTSRPWCIVSKHAQGYGVLVGRRESCRDWASLSCIVAHGSARFEANVEYELGFDEAVIAVGRVDQTRARFLTTRNGEALFLQDVTAPARDTAPVTVWKSEILDDWAFDAPHRPAQLVICGGCTVLSGVKLWRGALEPGVRTIHADEPIQRLHSRSAHDRWLVYTTATGVGVRLAVSPDGPTVLGCALLGSENGPEAVVLQAGFLIASDAASLVVVRMTAIEVCLEHRGPAPSSSLVTLAQMPRSDEFAWLQADGVVRVYRLAGF